MSGAMNEKSTLLPTAPTDERILPGSSMPIGQDEPIQMPSIILMPGLEFNPRRKSRYGLHAALASGLVFISFLLVEFRSCNAGIFIDLERLQALHISVFVFAFVAYLMSLFSIEEFAARYKFMSLIISLLMYLFVGLMAWTCYEAAVNPCVASVNFAPLDLSFQQDKNVFSRGDAIGIIVLLLDIVATLFMASAAMNFTRRT